MIFENALRKDAIDLLKQDHREVDAMFREFESTDDDDRKVELAETICGDLTVHAEIEEKIFYPAAREALPEDKQDLLAEATVEHASLKKLIADIDGSSPRDELFEANVKVLGEYVKHHVREEESELMPAVRRTNIDLQALGERLMQRKEALKSSQQQPARRGGSNRVRVPMPTTRSRTGSVRKSAVAKSPRRKTGATTRKSGSRSAAPTSARSRTAATRKRAAARKQGNRKVRGR